MSSEDQIQQNIVRELRLRSIPDLVWFHVPNQGKFPVQYRAKLKRMGLRPGVPDLVFMWPGGCGGIELKSATGRQSDTQKEMQELFAQVGAEYDVCRTPDSVFAKLKEWTMTEREEPKEEGQKPDGKKAHCTPATEVPSPELLNALRSEKNGKD